MVLRSAVIKEKDKQMISLIVEDKFLPDSEVKQKDFLYMYDLKQYQLDKMIAYGMKKGFFKFKNFIYQIYIDGEKVQPAKTDYTIVLPVATRNGRKVKFLIDNVVPDDNLPPKNTFKTIINIYDEDVPFKEFYLRVGISQYTLKNNIKNASSFTLNGVLVEVKRVTLKKIKYDVKNNRSGHTSWGLTSTEVIRKTCCKKLLLDQIDKFGFVCEYLNFSISLENTAPV